MKAWYQMTEDELCRELKTSKSGLSAAEVQKRLSQYGYNKRESIFTSGLLSNKPLLGAVVFTFMLQLLPQNDRMEGRSCTGIKKI